MKKAVLLNILLLFALSASAQKEFQVEIHLSKDIAPKKIMIHYQNGKTDVSMPDTFSRNTIQLRGEFYSQLLPIFIQYDKGRTQQGFFIDNKPAEISLYLSADGQLEYRKVTAAQPIYDTSNRIFHLLREVRKKEWDKGISPFLTENKGNIFHNDSLKQIYCKYLKRLNKVSINVLKKYPDSFFSFWYFTRSIAEPYFILFSKDTAYFRQLLHIFTTTFPSRYIESVAGKTFIQKLTRRIAPIQSGETAPLFSVKDLKGNQISLNKFKGKYVLLDFWATWCGPCMKEIPFIKKIRVGFPKNKLEIIDISWDKNLDSLKKKIKTEKMNWEHIYDRDADIIHLYGVHAIPQLFLINKKGKIIYKNIGYGSGKQELSDMLDHALNHNETKE